ncbi:hypothetical protein AB3G45_28125 [Shinella sp. S4-D37]|uniref:hypothetical protein n=1 Tax=Shinella sp. S4-D37 TaxID=3161999 RepID=UPI003464F462
MGKIFLKGAIPKPVATTGKLAADLHDSTEQTRGVPPVRTGISATKKMEPLDTLEFREVRARVFHALLVKTRIGSCRPVRMPGDALYEGHIAEVPQEGCRCRCPLAVNYDRPVTAQTPIEPQPVLNEQFIAEVRRSVACQKIEHLIDHFQNEPVSAVRYIGVAARRHPVGARPEAGLAPSGLIGWHRSRKRAAPHDFLLQQYNKDASTRLKNAGEGTGKVLLIEHLLHCA